MMGRPYAQDVKDEAFRLFRDEKMNLPEVAESLGVGVSALKDWFRKAKISTALHEITLAELKEQQYGIQQKKQQ